MMSRVLRSDSNTVSAGLHILTRDRASIRTDSSMFKISHTESFEVADSFVCLYGEIIIRVTDVHTVVGIYFLSRLRFSQAQIVEWGTSDARSWV